MSLDQHCSPEPHAGTLPWKCDRKHQCLTAPCVLCLHAQTDINSSMRAILIDWLVEVHYKFRVRAGSPSCAELQTNTSAVGLRMMLHLPCMHADAAAHVCH